jgi:hypothetical protein
MNNGASVLLNKDILWLHSTGYFVGAKAQGDLPTSHEKEADATINVVR